MKKMPQNRLPKCLKPKKQHFHWKNNSVSKKLIDSYEKNLQNRLPKCLKPKEKTLSLKKQFCFRKSLNSYEKNATEPSYKMLEAKNLHTHWKNNSVSKKLINSYDKNATEPSYNIEKTIPFQKNLWIHMKKRPQNRLPKCLKPKKQTLSLKKQFCFKKTYKFIWKNGHRTVFQNAWSQKNNTFLTKTVCSKQNL